jgi:hypothetical protein
LVNTTEENGRSIAMILANKCKRSELLSAAERSTSNTHQTSFISRPVYWILSQKKEKKGKESSVANHTAFFIQERLNRNETD